MTTIEAPNPAGPRAASVLAVLSNGAPQVITDPRFTRHHHVGQGVDYPAVLAEPGWSPGQQALISLAAALSGHGDLPSAQLSAHLTGRQSQLMLAMCRAARPPARTTGHTTASHAA